MGILRTLLALAVVAAHAGPILGARLPGGMIAVQTFYMISGFYMAFILNEKYIMQNGSYLLFITNRLLRLYPIYWFVLIMTIVLCLVHFAFGGSGVSLSPYLDNSISLSSYLYLIISQVFIIGQDVIMFMGIDNLGELFFTANYKTTNPRLHTFLFVPQAWTIGVEILFYLMVPFIARKKLIVPILIFSVSALLRVYFYKLGFRYDPWSYRFFPFEIAFFMLGIIAYHFSKSRYFLFKAYIAKILFLGIIIFTVFYQDFPGFWKYKMLVYFLFVVISIPFLFNLFKYSKWDRWIGELSYPIYIGHIFINRITGHIMDLQGTQINGILVSFLSIIMSIFLLRYISYPIEKYRQKRVIKA